MSLEIGCHLRDVLGGEALPCTSEYVVRGLKKIAIS